MCPFYLFLMILFDFVEFVMSRIFYDINSVFIGVFDMFLCFFSLILVICKVEKRLKKKVNKEK